MLTLLKIDYVMYRVSDLSEAERFYVDVLGMKKVWDDPAARMIGFEFEGSSSEIVVHTRTDLPKSGYAYLVDDVERTCREFLQAGYRVQQEPMDVRPGKFAVLLDPDGNELPIIDLSAFGGEPRYGTSSRADANGDTS